MIKPGKMISEVVAAFFEKPSTVQYPFVKPAVPDKFRGRIVFVPEKCVGCKACVRDCPAKAIEINKVADKAFDAVIYSDRCIFCAQCVDSCPKDALIATPEFELAQIDRKKLTTVYHAQIKKESAEKPQPTQEPAP